ncbi:MULTISPECIES: flagellar hook assembly protein FlgD [unclassified Devosia]|jgi:flagellar basal-body rod modification protein FlgD|uniref:flagellar hook assembly protein FlgD n=1 Tax=unclassified Devosia TaxID=196773 RepID=UPI00086A2457|nr:MULTISPECIES: flagellar hook assembly protein FlgD [unclassified Devosia]MBN9364552.1 flagellar hook assembly protein FlgD [Devosia sp.]ODS95139.1 MAG: flagellar hook capping protein [Devosia sp. SCN 66-27]OJX25438.1 MAG: flagellar hook capping protein [Devosia sp. 66-14]
MAVSGVNSSASNALNNSRQSIAQNFDTFLQLLTTQLRNQNPLDPLDTNQFTQQLVQFTGVEQQLKTNEFLQAMMTSTQTANNSQAVSYVGKVVTASGSKAELVDGSARWNFAVAAKANITATVKDANGNVVYTKSGTVDKGESVFTWDGIGNDGTKKANGTYSVSIEARDVATGKLVGVATEMTGEVTGVDFSGSEPVLIVGTARVNLSAILSVRAKTAADTPPAEESAT